MMTASDVRDACSLSLPSMAGAVKGCRCTESHFGQLSHGNERQPAVAESAQCREQARGTNNVPKQVLGEDGERGE